jgi:gluconolactonase
MKSFRGILLVIPGLIILWGCFITKKVKMASLEIYQESFKEIVNGNLNVEIIGEGYKWSEGPLWVESEKMLLFSDVPGNVVYKWTAAGGTVPYLSPSGYTGTKERPGEVGSNGLALNADGKLVLAQHGDRRIALMDGPVHTGFPSFISLADRYQGKRFNSPNDLCIASDGTIYFTDPPYGLPQQEKDPSKELPFQGVFKIVPGEKPELMTDGLSRPNGIALTPDERQVIVSNSDPDNAAWYIYDLDENKNFINGRVLLNVTDSLHHGPGLPDGLKIDSKGNIFATGPGGIWIMNLNGEVLGKIKIQSTASNCALSGDEKTLFVTADKYVLKLKIKN